MAKNKLTDWSTTAGSNEDIGGIDIRGTAKPSNFDDAEREMMAQLAKVNAGTDPVADTWTFADPADLTKRARLDAGNVTAGQTRVLTMADKNLDLAKLDGSLHKITVHASSTTHNFDADSTKAYVIVIGGGGAGGGSTVSSVAHGGAGAGGGEGGRAEKFIDLTGIDDATIVIGAGGTAVAGGNGNSGGQTSYSDGVNTLTANGGNGGAFGGGTAFMTVKLGGSGGTASGGDINLKGAAGENALHSGTSDTAAALGLGGNGGNGGRGGAVRSTSNTFEAGQNGERPGSGGGGCARCTISSADDAGGNGADGIVIILEYR